MGTRPGFERKKDYFSIRYAKSGNCETSDKDVWQADKNIEREMSEIEMCTKLETQPVKEAKRIRDQGVIEMRG